jgi:LemA protein
MNEPEPRIPTEKVSEVLALASRLQAEHSQDYSLSELMQAGAEANISPDFIQQAVEQIQTKPSLAQQRQQKLKVGLIGAGVAVALWSFWVGKVPLAQGHCAPTISSMQESTGTQNTQRLI